MKVQKEDAGQSIKEEQGIRAEQSIKAEQSIREAQSIKEESRENSVQRELAVELQHNAQSGEYPFHMPGHKRNSAIFRITGDNGHERNSAIFRITGDNGHKRNSAIFRITDDNEHEPQQTVLDELCRLDITEMEGFDNLHDPKGILKECMEHAAKVCRSEHTYFLVNGSSCGNIAAILASVPRKGKLVVARNCHMSVYHAITINDLTPCYIVPDSGQFCGEITPGQVETALIQNPDAEAVIITSPTYEGIVSDIKEIAAVVHRYRKILIVDEAHGAHFGFHAKFPESAHHLGADLSIQSVHKTLTGFTQSAVLHLNHDRVDKKRLEEALRMVQSSSPSYLFMAGLDRTFHLIETGGEALFEKFYIQLEQFRKQAAGWKNFRLYSGREGFFDPSKLVILCEDLIWRKEKNRVTGQNLLERLKREYGLVLEMGAYSHAIAMTSIADREEGYQRLLSAMAELDRMVEKSKKEQPQGKTDRRNEKNPFMLPEKRWNPSECFYRKKEIMSINKAEGRAAGDYVYLYPPGIPILVPGEVIHRECILQIKKYFDAGMEVKGIKNIEGSLQLDVVAEEKIGV